MGAKLYHSIHARGERVEDVLKEFEAKDDTQNGQAVAGEGNPGDAENAKPANGVVSDELEDGELEDESEPNLQAANDVGELKKFRYSFFLGTKFGR